MSSSFLKVRLDEDLKKEASDLSKSLGLTISEAVRMFLVTFVKEQKIPFDIEKPNKKTIKALKDAEEGRTTRYASFTDLVKEVDQKLENDKC